MTTPPKIGHEQEDAHREYTKRINRALDFIDANLSKELSVPQIAKVACFSQFHFHRLFTAMMGETINAYTRRRRLEVAAMRLRNSPNESITDIALDCGFGSSSTFARAFRAHFGCSAGQWRKQERDAHLDAKSKIGQAFRKIRTVETLETRKIGPQTSVIRWMVQMQDQQNIESRVEVRDEPSRTIAYVRHVGPYAGNTELFGRLIDRITRWGLARGLSQEQCLPIIVGHDDPMITAEDKLRISVGVTVPAGTVPEHEIGVMSLPQGRYAVATFEVPTQAIPGAWQALKAGWLPSSGYQPDDRPCFERVLRSPREHPQGLHHFEIYFPVRPL